MWRVFGVSILALGVLGLLIEAGRIAWHEARTLRYLQEPWGDEWQ